MRLSSLALLGVMVAALPAHGDIVSYTDSTNPLAFFPLQSQAQGSTVNGYTTSYVNGASDVTSAGGPQSNAVSLNGNNNAPQYVATSLNGGINGAGSINAYINLSAPLNNQIYYIAGESQNGDDFDFQLVSATSTTASLCFYTDAGSSTCATVLDSELVSMWNMVTATYDSSTGDQDVYLNGTLVAENANGTAGAKVNQFTIGYSTVFGGRDFDGLVSDVGVWNYQLSATQVADLYAAGTQYSPTPVGATPEPSSIALLGTGLLGVAGVLKRRFA